MRIVITGGLGFLGQRLAKILLKTTAFPLKELVLVDERAPSDSLDDPRVRYITYDLSAKDNLNEIITPSTDAVFHLAAIVSSHAELDPDLGFKINFLATYHLLERCRAVNPHIRFIFASSLAVFGGELPRVVSDSTAVTPESSYGSQKAMAELLVNDYSRRGFVDGLVLRLPTIAIRAGKPNKAASSFVSSIIREPLAGKQAICPVHRDLKLYLCSPDTMVKNFIHALSLPCQKLGRWRVINAPGISISVAEMIETLTALKGKDIEKFITFDVDEQINAIVASWPAVIDNTPSLHLGFSCDQNFSNVIVQFIERDL